ncbi:hypothetical protein GQ53DRAFT_750661 [Thozetella sp. PMI_491]|nr:hypothetical protein GQ53DRAFT_750661 [Thozetella sp. PMI_491]
MATLTAAKAAQPVREVVSVCVYGAKVCASVCGSEPSPLAAAEVVRYPEPLGNLWKQV